MALAEGPNQRALELQADDGRHIYAKLKDTDFHSVGPIYTTDDPNWIYSEKSPYLEKVTEWLRYRHWSGDKWECKCRCEYQPPGSLHQYKVEGRFEHRPIGHGGKAHDGPIIHFLDWDGNRWEAEIQRVDGPFPKPPVFTLRRK